MTNLKNDPRGSVMCSLQALRSLEFLPHTVPITVDTEDSLKFPPFLVFLPSGRVP